MYCHSISARCANLSCKWESKSASLRSSVALGTTRRMVVTRPVTLKGVVILYIACPSSKDRVQFLGRRVLRRSFIVMAATLSSFPQLKSVVCCCGMWGAFNSPLGNGDDLGARSFTSSGNFRSRAESGPGEQRG